MKRKLKVEEPGVESMAVSARDADERGRVHANQIRLADRSRRVHPHLRVLVRIPGDGVPQVAPRTK